VYHHHRSRVLLDSVYHTIYPGDYILWVLPLGLQLGRFPLHADRVTEPNFVALVVTCAVAQSALTSFHPVSGQLQVLEGIIVDVV
jgi:hypothetical protein